MPAEVRAWPRRQFARAIVYSAVFAAFAPSCRPQAQAPVVGQNAGTTRSIEGQVLSKTGEAIAGAIVLLKDTKTLQVRSYIAQTEGRYHFFGLSTDINYEVRAEAKGLSSKTKTLSVFDSHKIVKLNLKLTKKLRT